MHSPAGDSDAQNHLGRQLSTQVILLAPYVTIVFGTLKVATISQRGATLDYLTNRDPLTCLIDSHESSGLLCGLTIGDGEIQRVPFPRIKVFYESRRFGSTGSRDLSGSFGH